MSRGRFMGDGGDAALAATPVRAGLGRAAAKQAAGVALAAAVVALCAERFRGVDPAALAAALAGVAPGQWLAALVCSALSFWAVGRYDGVLHRHLGTRMPPAVARRAGVTAIALSQAAGFGLVTGALARWRMLPGLGLGAAARLTAAVAATFLAGWAVVTAAAVLCAPAAGFAPLRPAAAGVLGLAAAAALAVTLLPPSARIARRVALPGIATLAAILGLAALDTTAAALALWAVLPAAADPGLAALLPAALVALGAGLVLSTPGGIGPFELALMTLLPGLPEPELLAGVLAWRAVYFAGPAALAVLALALGPRPARTEAAPRPIAPGSAAALPFAPLLAAAPRAETGLLQLGEHALLPSACGTGALMVGQTRQTLAALFDPLGQADRLPALLDRLDTAARAGSRLPCLYKLSPRAAARVRRAGWQVLPVAEDAVIDLAAFDLARPACAGLRRKLRRAAQAGIAVAEPRPLPMPALERIARDWARARGGERGFSMGRFAPGYLDGQRVFVASAGGEPLAFASFHEGPREWTLDLMRHTDDCPDGTMQALVAAAIDAARAAGADRLSLAAAPAPRRLAAHLPGRVPARLRRRLAARLSAREAACGLRRFKDGFAPRWQPLYLAAPSRPALLVAAADLALHIRAPAPLPGSRSS